MLFWQMAYLRKVTVRVGGLLLALLHSNVAPYGLSKRFDRRAMSSKKCGAPMMEFVQRNLIRHNETESDRRRKFDHGPGGYAPIISVTGRLLNGNALMKVTRQVGSQRRVAL